MSVVNLWHAECLPCGWLELHDDENDAIRAAEDHVFAHHRDVNPAVRGEKKMGHVQMRTVTDLPGSGSERYGASRPDVFDAKPTGAAINASSPAIPSEVTLTTPKGETITVKE